MDVESVYRQEVFSVSPTDPLMEAARRMQAKGVGALLVISGESLLGIISERDVCRAVSNGDPLERTTVIEYMTSNPITVTPDTGVREAAALMLEVDIRHLPVAAGDEVVGMLSMRDLMEPVVNAAPL